MAPSAPAAPPMRQGPMHLRAGRWRRRWYRVAFPGGVTHGDGRLAPPAQEGWPAVTIHPLSPSGLAQGPVPTAAVAPSSPIVIVPTIVTVAGRCVNRPRRRAPGVPGHRAP